MDHLANGLEKMAESDGSVFCLFVCYHREILQWQKHLGQILHCSANAIYGHLHCPATLKVIAEIFIRHSYTKIGMVQGRLAWLLRKDDTQIREAFHIL